MRFMTSLAEDSVRVWVLSVLSLSVLGLSPTAAHGQGLAGTVHIGTSGLGGRVAFPLSGQVNLRGGLDFQPFRFEFDDEDIAYVLELPSPSLSALLDWHPGGVGFRFSGGIVYFVTELEFEGKPLADVEVGDGEYTPSEIGSLIGSLGTSQIAPYLGIGWGNSPRGGIGFSADVGVALHGTPDARLRATGPIRDDPTFLSDLETDIEDINDDVEIVKVYPVLNLGISFGL